MNNWLAAVVSELPKQPELRPNRPPVDVPVPTWIWVALAVTTLVGCYVLVVYLKYRFNKPKRRRSTGAREIARRALRDLEARMDRSNPYDFSIAVSDILRAFISKQFRLPATQQTSVEFLNSISSRVDFSKGDQHLLGKFLERCDMIKFAKEEGNEQVCVELMNAAMAFVDGGRE